MSDTNTRIAQIVNSNDVVLFMKGTPLFPQCGFSSKAVAILDRLGVARVIAVCRVRVLAAGVAHARGYDAGLLADQILHAPEASARQNRRLKLVRHVRLLARLRTRWRRCRQMSNATNEKPCAFSAPPRCNSARAGIR